MHMVSEKEGVPRLSKRPPTRQTMAMLLLQSMLNVEPIQ